MNKRIDAKVLENMLKKRSSTEIFLQALIEISPYKTGYRRFFVIAFITLIPSILMARSINTVPLFLKAVEIFNTVTIGLFGIVFMGYAFFQALINDDLLKRLLDARTDDNEDESKLQESNEYFAKVMMMDIIAIIINVLILLILGSIEKNFNLPFFDDSINNIIAFLFILVYLNFSLQVVWEMKSFVFNLFQLFNTHNVSKALKMMNEDKENDTQKK